MHFGDIWFLIPAWIAGAVAIFFLYRRRKRLENAEQPATKSEPGMRSGPAPKSETGTRSGVKAHSPEKPVVVRRAIGNGFRGLRWGQAPPEGMQVVHEEGESQFLSNPTDGMNFGRVLVSSIIYSFQRNRLQAVIIELPIFGFDPLLRELTAEWGPPRSTPSPNTAIWFDSPAGPDATQAALERRQEGRTVRLVLTSREMLAEREKTRPGV